VHPISRLGRWEGYDVAEDWQEVRAGLSVCVIRLEPIRGQPRCCSGCGEFTAAVHDLEDRRVRDLPVFEHRVELIVPRVRVACARCGPKLEQLSWLARYARVTQRMAESVGGLCQVMAIRHVARYFGLDWKTVKDLDRELLER
jgi:transposase